MQDLVDGLTTGRCTFGERVGGGTEANVYALDGPLGDLVIRLKRITEDGPVDQRVDQDYHDVADRLLRERMQRDLAALEALGRAGLNVPDPRLVQWRYPETGATQAGIVMDRLRGTAFRVPDHFGAGDPPDVVYDPTDPGPDVVNETTLSDLLCARDAVVGLQDRLGGAAGDAHPVRGVLPGPGGWSSGGSRAAGVPSWPTTPSTSSTG